MTSEMIWYGILDVLAGPVFLVFFLWELRAADYNAFCLQSGKYTDKSGYVTNNQGPAAPVTKAEAAGDV